VISFLCPHCGYGLNVPDEFAGKEGRCTACKNTVVAPISGASAQFVLPPRLPQKPRKQSSSANQDLQKSARIAFGGCLGISSFIVAIPLVLVGGCIVLAAIGSQLPDPPSRSAPQRNSPQRSYAPVTAPERIAEPKITLAEFNALQTGMTYQQAVAILGEQGTVMSENTIAGSHTVMYSWENDGFLAGNMNAMFQNGELISKSQLGLK